MQEIVEHPHTDGHADMAHELFREEQPLHQNLIVRVLVPLETVIVLAVVVPMLWAGVSLPPLPVLGLIVAVVVGVPMLLLTVRLTTIVTDRELIIRYRPFPGRRVPIGEIRKAEAIRYNPIASGGWGWRISGVYHRVFNVSGDRGVHVTFGEGKSDQFLVGSRNAEALAEAIELARFAASDNA